MINPELIKEINAHTLAQYPKEMCGVVTASSFIPLENIHEDPTKSFRVSREEWAEHRDACLVFVHSHPDAYPCPSESDMIHQMSSGVAWGILATDGQRTTDIKYFGDQVPIPDLKNRTFCHGITDCYSIIRDWFRLERGIILDEIPRSWEWWAKGGDLYRDNFKRVGFSIVPESEILKDGLKTGYVFLGNIGQSVLKLNHGGIYLGNGQILHHLTAQKPVDDSRLACSAPLQRWNKYVSMWVRYDEKN